MSKMNDTSAPMEISTGGGATENKYDRQLRLWQMHGQLALLNARVLVLNSGPVATEFLKNIILPGTGRQGVDLEGNKINGIIRIVDDAVVTKRDLGNNFFVRAEAIGRRRCDVVMETLQELNPDDTNVTSDVQNVDNLISSNPKYFDDFTLVVGTQLSRTSALALDEICRARGIPLILGKINGLIGYIRNCVNCHEVIESNPGDYVHRLHGRDPWPELIELSKKVSVDVSTQKSLGDKLKMHKEVPWLLLLVNKIQEEKIKSNLDINEICTNYSKRSQLLRNLCKDSESFIDPINAQRFQEGIKAGKTEEEMNNAMIPSPALNYSQARAQGATCLKPFRLPGSPEFEAIMNDDRIKSKSPPKLGNDFSGNFWKMARALNRFLEKHKRFPVRKEIPDMEAGNKYYVMLKLCFRRKAEADCKLFREELKLEYVSLVLLELRKRRIFMFSCSFSFTHRTLTNTNVYEHTHSQQLDTVIACPKMMSSRDSVTTHRSLKYLGQDH